VREEKQLPRSARSLSIGEKPVGFNFSECPDSLEVLQRRLHKPGIKRLKVLCDLNFGTNDNMIESKLARLAWELSDDGPISQRSVGEIAEPAP